MELEKTIVEHFSLVGGTLFGLIGASGVARAWSKSKRSHLWLKKSIQDKTTLPATLHPIIDTARCIGCESCVAACPEEGVLQMIQGKATLVRPQKCVGHGDCKTVCPEKAIELVFGTNSVAFEIPRLNSHYQTDVSGLHIAGELGGMGLIRNAVKQGQLAVRSMAVSPKVLENVYDLLIVGAGPAGMAAALEAKQRNLKFLLIEQDRLGGTIAHYPRRKLVMSSTLQMPLVGEVRFKRNTVLKEELIELWHRWHKQFSLPISLGEKLIDLQKEDEFFVAKSSKKTILSKKVLLCLGVSGSPRKLGIQGEEGAHNVYYRLDDPEQFKKLDLVVIGGGNSAAECAEALSEPHLHNRVKLLVKEKSMERANEENIKRLQLRKEQGHLEIFYETWVKSMNDKTLTVMSSSGEKTLPADFTFALIGQERPFQLLKSWGISIKQYFGETLLVLIFILSGCQPERPAAESLISPITAFSHTGLTQTCTQCHEKDRPANHYVGQDCVTCHNVDAWKTSVSYSHVPAPSTCVECHKKDMPTTDHGQGLDCI